MFARAYMGRTWWGAAPSNAITTRQQDRSLEKESRAYAEALPAFPLKLQMQRELQLTGVCGPTESSRIRAAGD